MFRGHHRKVRMLFGLSDLLLIGWAFKLEYATRVGLELGHEFFLSAPIQGLLMGWSMLVWVVLGYWWELYDRIDAAHPRVILRDAFRQCLTATALLILFEYLQRLELSRPFVAIFAVYAWVLLCLFRLNAGRILRLARREFGAAHYVMVVGLGQGARKLGRELEEARSYGVRLTGFLADSPSETEFAEVTLEGKYPVRPLAQLPELLRQHVIDEIIFAVDSRRLAELEEIFLLCDEEGVRTRGAVDFSPPVTSEVH